MKLTSKEMDEIVADLIEKGRAMIKEKEESVVVDQSLVDSDLYLMSKLSPAIHEDIGMDRDQIERTHRSFLAYQVRDKVKRGYVLKDEVRRLAPEAKTFAEIVDAINPLKS